MNTAQVQHRLLPETRQTQGHSTDMTWTQQRCNGATLTNYVRNANICVKFGTLCLVSGTAGVRRSLVWFPCPAVSLLSGSGFSCRTSTAEKWGRRELRFHQDRWQCSRYGGVAPSAVRPSWGGWSPVGCRTILSTVTFWRQPVVTLVHLGGWGWVMDCGGLGLLTAAESGPDVLK